jgi:hypothetical protein
MRVPLVEGTRLCILLRQNPVFCCLGGSHGGVLSHSATELIPSAILIETLLELPGSRDILT